MFLLRKDGFDLGLISNSIYGTVRIATFHNDPDNTLLCALDLATTLGYRYPRPVVNKLNIAKIILNVESMNYLLDPYTHKAIEYPTTFTNFDGMVYMVMNSKMPNTEDFKMWIARTIGKINNGTLDVQQAQSELQDFGLTPRKRSTIQRNKTTSSLSRNQKMAQGIYPNLTNAVYNGVLGADARTLKELIGLPKNGDLRSALRPDIIGTIESAENDLESYEDYCNDNNITINNSHVPKLERDFRINYGDNPYNLRNSNYPIFIAPYNDEAKENINMDLLLELLKDKMCR